MRPDETDEDAIERRRRVLALELPPSRFFGWKRILALAALLAAALIAAASFASGGAR